MQQLVAELRQKNAVRREAAIARLRVLGHRALARLSTVATEDDDPAARASALKVLDGLDDPKVPSLALRAMSDADVDVRVAAIAVLRPWLVREEGTGIMDALVAAALDRDQPSAVRLAALDALAQLPRDIVQPVFEQTSIDADPSALDEPAAVQEWLAGHADAPLSLLHALIARVRERESGEPQPARRREWLVVRGATHAALARRKSRVALYDVREAFDAAESPLPLDFLTAVGALGDVTCLEPMARAWAASPHEAWWRARLSEAAAAIVRGHGLTGRNAMVKRIRTRWPGFL